jgi:Protein of unknown function (DUF3110)
MRVFVLLFNARTEHEGIHSLQIGDRNLVLAFEDEDDASRYAMLLEAQDFMIPTVESIDYDEIEDFCQGVGYECQLVPQGFKPQSAFDRLLIAPPEQNLEQTDWQVEDDAQEDQETALDDPLASSNPELDRIRRQLEGLL